MFEIYSPHVSFDDNYPEMSNFVYGEWMLEDRYITKSLVNELKLSKIQYKAIVHKEKKNRQKRALRVYNDKSIKINSENLADNYYSVDQVQGNKLVLSLLSFLIRIVLL